MLRVALLCPESWSERIGEEGSSWYKMHPRLYLLWPTKIFLDFVAGNGLACPYKLLLTHYLHTTEHHWKENSQTLQPHLILSTRLENELHVNGSYCGFVYCKSDIQPKHQLKKHLIQWDLLCWVPLSSNIWLLTECQRSCFSFLFLNFLAGK